MTNGGERMMPKHSWACIAHYRANLLTHSRFVAMDGALFAGWFLLAILAMLQTGVSIFEQCCALWAEPIRTMFMTMAIDCHYMPDGALFSFYTRHDSFILFSISFLKRKYENKPMIMIIGASTMSTTANA